MISILVKRYNVEDQAAGNLAYYTNLSYLKKQLRTMIKNGDAKVIRGEKYMPTKVNNSNVCELNNIFENLIFEEVPYNL